jgi:hypothetical protein
MVEIDAVLAPCLAVKRPSMQGMKGMGIGRRPIWRRSSSSEGQTGDGADAVKLTSTRNCEIAMPRRWSS